MGRLDPPVEEMVTFNQYALDEIMDEARKRRTDPDPDLAVTPFLVIGDVIASNARLYLTDPNDVAEARRWAMFIGAVGRVVAEIWEQDLCAHEVQIAFTGAMERVVASAKGPDGGVPTSDDQG